MTNTASENVLKKVLAILASLCITSCTQQDVLTDSRDGKKYKTFKIGSQTWMAENLNYEADGQ